MLKNICSILALFFIILMVYLVSFKFNKLNLVDIYEIKDVPDICEDVKLGGFSDLFYKDGYLYAIADRGPNLDDYEKDGKIFRKFSCPEYTTYLVKFKIENNVAKIIKATPIKELSGIPISAEKDSIPIDKNGKQIPFNIDGADVESFVIDKNGNYWLGEEYYPSIIKLDKDLKVVKRFAPIDSPVKNPKITYNLPEEFNHIMKNRGFESMTYDGREHIYVFTQSDLKNKKDIKVIKFNINTEKVDEILKYKFSEKNIMSAATYVDDNNFYIAEKLYNKHFLDKITLKNDIYKRTSILRLLSQKDKIKGNIKIEGLAMDDENNLYIINDNDFGIDDKNVKNSFIMKFHKKK